MAWTYAFDTATPAGSDAPATLDNDARTKALALQERLNADHYFPLTGTAVSDTDAGKHRKLTAQAVLAAKPTLDTGEAALYTKTVSGVSEWFWEDSDGTEHQLTNGGAINVSAAEILGLLANDTYFTAVDNAGTGTTDLIKAGQNEAADTDVAILPDLTRLATNAAPLEDTALANKKYVDDQVATKALGSRTSTDTNSATIASGETYLAQCDGYLSVTGGYYSTYIYSDSSSPPTAIASHAHMFANDGGYLKAHLGAMIISGEYVKITGSITNPSWVPFGTGGLVKQ